MLTRLRHALAILAAGLLIPKGLAHEPAAEMAEAARRWLDSLSAEQRETALIPWADEERLNWHFIPRDRRGLAWKDMSDAQRQLAMGLLASGLSHRGFLKSTTIMSLEDILRDLEQGRGPVRDTGRYHWTVFGEPAADATWGWRVEGHHLSLNFTLVKGRGVAVTPSFLGTNPAEVPSGPRKGLRVLAAEEDLGRELLKSLNDEQRRKAVISETAPRDILTGAERKVSPLSPAGLAAAEMNDSQKELLHRLIEEYVRRVRPELADADLRQIDEAGRDKIHFAWAGSAEPRKGHYYRIQGPTFLLEYDNTQNDANHIHAVWRDFDGDFGEDLLSKHYEESH